MVDADTTSPPPALFKKRTAKAKTALRKRAATPPPASDSDSSFYSSADEAGARIKRRKRNTGAIKASSNGNSSNNHNGGGVAAAGTLGASTHAADRSATIDVANDATKQSNWYEERGDVHDGASTTSATAGSSAGALGNVTAPAAGTYAGLRAYRKTHVQRSKDGQERADRAALGPVKAPTNIRTITVTDFAPDVCKDYKQTGFCGFGDSCKFLHAREDYKQGWQLDREWENVTKAGGGGKAPGGVTVASARRKAASDEAEDAASDDDDEMLRTIPFACIVCKGPYKDPIVTKCGHYFCERCALQRFRKGPSCVACGAGTGGVFNTAKGLRKLLERKRERARIRRERAAENGEEASEDEEAETAEGDAAV